MAKRLKSPQFAQWIRAARIQIGKSQKELAGLANISQQDWSKLERDGVLPSDDRLAAVCEALGRPESEARKILAGTTTADQRAQWSQLNWLAFRESLVERAEACPDDQPLQVFVIRDDSIHVDDVVVQLHYELFSRTSNLRLFILFRFDARNDWMSFTQLAEQLAIKWRSHGRDINDLRKWLWGYHRTKEFQEDKDTCLPMPHPVLIIRDSGGPSLYYVDVNPEVLTSQLRIGLSASEAQLNSLVLLPSGSREKAHQFAGWIGSIPSSESKLPTADRPASERWWLNIPLPF